MNLTKTSLASLFCASLSMSAYANFQAPNESNHPAPPPQPDPVVAIVPVAGAASGAVSGSESGAISGSKSESNSLGIGTGGNAESNGLGIGTGGNAESNGLGIGTGGKSSSESTGGASESKSSSTSSAAGGSVSDVKGGESESKSAAEAKVGNTEIDGSGGDATGASVGDVSPELGVEITSTYEAAAASAASVFVGYCQTGASAQVVGGGFGVTNPDSFCDHVRLANFLLTAYEREVLVGNGESERAQRWLEAYYDNVDDAINLIERSEFTATMDRMTGFTIRPAALIGILIMLL